MCETMSNYEEEREKVTPTAMQIVIHAGDARNLIMEVPDHAVEGLYDQTEDKLKEAREELRQIHIFQTEVVQSETGGKKYKYLLLPTHAQDAMTTICTEINPTKKAISMHRKLDNRISKLGKKAEMQGVVRTQHKFPQGFLWGNVIVTSQADGGFREDQKGMFTVDFHPYGNIKNRDDRREDSIIRNDESFPMIEPGLYYPKQHGADFYHRFEEDLDLMEEMGFKAFRISFDWNHIYPKRDEKEPNEAGLGYYDRLIASIRFHGMEPSIVISHYEMPVHLIKKYGGWLNRSLMGFFAVYCNTLPGQYHGQIKYWIVLNQINLTIFNSLGVSGNRAKNFMEAEYQGVHHQFLACVRAEELAGKYKGQIRVGTMLSDKLAYPATCRSKDMFFSMRKDQMQYSFPDVRLRGSYPAYAFRFFEENHTNTHIDPENERLLRENPVDFPSTSCCYTKINDSLKNVYTSMDKSTNPYLEKTEWGWEIDPIGLRISPNHYSDRYPGIPIYIMEDSYGIIDRLGRDGAVRDPYRIDYLRQYAIQMKEVAADDVPLKGYMMWTPMGIVSCSSAEVKRRYGLTYVDQDNEGDGSRRRHRKDSSYQYQKVIESNGGEL